ncbi:MAG: DNA mismatch repair protein MutS [Oscillospiraceae bacterium]|nr:DNA mismatch repair protein MutS [Oscillospiraceae bacterium]
MAELTPMRRQYLKMKERHPDCILFFRLGDFYEMFDEDAITVSRELDLTLTTRDRGKAKEDQTPMCGVPYHSYQGYLARLIAKGYKVAICEQTEDPAQAKGLVDREVIRIVTPGTVVESAMLEEGKNNFIAGVYLDSQGGGLCFCDLSTGEVFATAFHGADVVSHLINELGRFFPTEAVLSDGAFAQPELLSALKNRLNCACENGGEASFRLESARQAVNGQFASCELPERETAALQAAGGLLAYLYETQKTDLSHLSTLTWYAGGQFMELDLTTRRNLELTETMRAKEKRGSLLWVLDQTRTSMGGRLIRAWLERPLLSPALINRRLEAVKALMDDLVTREELAVTLKEITDLERLIGRVAYGTANGRDLVGLAGGLGQVPRLRQLLEGVKSPLLAELRDRLDSLDGLRELIGRAIVDDPPFSVREGGFIRKGYNEDVDYLQDVMHNGKDMVIAMEAQEKEKTGIKNMKISYNKVFGYYIEVTKSQTSLVPDSWVRKQTTVNSERYISQELKEMEHTILSARDKVTGLEYELFTQLREIIAGQVGGIQRTAAAVAQVDVLVSFAAVAAKHHYCMPTVDESGVIEISDGRHPVVEQVLKDSLFVPNDTRLDSGDNKLAIITGPNMAGKSTYMRQVALICLMAQIGSFVPARSARLGVVDRVFTRIGASDDLAAGQSTFMVEMSEVAGILRDATRQSLIILDEIGRGTSTYDGMSIARAVLEYCADPKKLGAKTLFATHYHELTVLEGQLPGVKNYNIAAKKRDGDITFLRKIVRGGADQSYGVEVAQLAGVPSKVIRRAKSILEELERGESAPLQAAAAPEEEQVSFGDLGAQEAADRLRKVDINTLTPIEAMNLIFELKQKL